MKFIGQMVIGLVKNRTTIAVKRNYSIPATFRRVYILFGQFVTGKLYRKRLLKDKTNFSV